jgi:hypothetical protein
MEPIQASVTGTFRIIAVLILIWVVLRLLRNRFGGGTTRKPTNWAPPEQRPKGEVRIERIKDPEKGSTHKPGSVTDADFEEVK